MYKNGFFNNINGEFNTNNTENKITEYNSNTNSKYETISKLHDIERQVSYHVTGSYSAYSYHVIA